MKENKTYLGKIIQSAKTVAKGMSVSGKHMRKGHKNNEPLGIEDPGYFNSQSQGPITIQYPTARIPVPDTGRYRLHMETDDCIGCDKCARICPVDCITIETFRADGDLGKTSDGTLKRLHLPVFDIDMAKCMYCGLCTTVCPTECLIMTKVYDYSEFDRDNFVYHFGAYSPNEEMEIREETDKALALKKAEKAKAGTTQKKRPVIRRKPVITDPDTQAAEPKPKPVRRKAVIKQKEGEVTGADTKSGENKQEPSKSKKRVRPVMKRKVEEEPVSLGGGEKEDSEENKSVPSKPKKRARPVMKRKVEEGSVSLGGGEKEGLEEKKAKPKKRARPMMKPKEKPGDEAGGKEPEE